MRKIKVLQQAGCQIRRLVSATCLARRSVPSVSAILRLAASSLRIVSRADMTFVGPAACLIIGLIVTVEPSGVFTETMVFPFRCK
ncbi:hypothetical protein [Mesorhizobium delmotii]|uniref:hypothetical protein n=1 Tax=Mesorhizobium delmotii TaxID=1631247 RepID=UPI001AD82CE0|nr:hypothetical protein [Mesorhizobium delmotii]